MNRRALLTLVGGTAVAAQLPRESAPAPLAQPTDPLAQRGYAASSCAIYMGSSPPSISASAGSLYMGDDGKFYIHDGSAWIEKKNV